MEENLWNANESLTQSAEHRILLKEKTLSFSLTLLGFNYYIPKNNIFLRLNVKLIFIQHARFVCKGLY